MNVEKMTILQLNEELKTLRKQKRQTTKWLAEVRKIGGGEERANAPRFQHMLRGIDSLIEKIKAEKKSR